MLLLLVQSKSGQILRPLLARNWKISRTMGESFFTLRPGVKVCGGARCCTWNPTTQIRLGNYVPPSLAIFCTLLFASISLLASSQGASVWLYQSSQSTCFNTRYILRSRPACDFFRKQTKLGHWRLSSKFKTLGLQKALWGIAISVICVCHIALTRRIKAHRLASGYLRVFWQVDQYIRWQLNDANELVPRSKHAMMMMSMCSGLFNLVLKYAIGCLLSSVDWMDRTTITVISQRTLGSGPRSAVCSIHMRGFYLPLNVTMVVVRQKYNRTHTAHWAFYCPHTNVGVHRRASHGRLVPPGCAAKKGVTAGHPPAIWGVGKSIQKV